MELIDAYGLKVVQAYMDHIQVETIYVYTLVFKINLAQYKFSFELIVTISRPCVLHHRRYNGNYITKSPIRHIAIVYPL